MLSIRLQGAAPPADHEPSAAGTLRLMTAAHAAGGAVRAPARLLLNHHPHQAGAVGVGVGGVVGGGKVYAGAVRAPPPRAQFYGHNPNLKLPPDLFLLGCVFHIVEYQQSWGTERVARWAEAIVRRGGEVEAGYCARVTHVLCETQKHGVVMQALRDAKRCVTAYWLSDAMLRRGVAPPWQALHLPSMYAARDRPARHHRCAISGWRDEERDRITFCVEHIGAKLTPYMTRDNTVLICKRAEGNKYRRAREWGIPVVTAAWLTDLLLGNMSALAQIENAKYQQFNLASPFRMDYSLVSHLMNAWKMPINITQESNERAKRSAAAALTQRRAKRPRLSPPRPPAPAALQQPPLHLAPRVLFSAVPHHDQNRLAAIVRQLGGLVVTSAAEATHLVMERLVRTSKLVACLVSVKHLLSCEWVRDSQRQGKFADEAAHELRDEAFNSMFKCDIGEVLLSGEQRRKLFEGITFFLTPCVKPSRSALTEMIELCGGKVEKNRRSYVSIQEMHTQKPFSYLVLTVPNDLHLVYYLLQSEKTLNVVCSTEVVLSAIMRQKLEVEEFLVKID
ncbi:PAX-interacting protein 1-like isoform X2 [Ostrinia furnacalis]|uniref:PAX-interacting protein 1-like isoform X1 n=1 Tax=Ostrinia furnacalis TaxID=93504 RepID=UPI00103DAC65|nr:PAX-interacting protein 1-like isoform X1 [Ostrinia furnacalis]XP_028172651.1 PAX-interacting protein 1-like isoform X2 [Ostrinia furnacalis]